MKPLSATGAIKFSAIEIVDAFEEFGWDCPRAPWIGSASKLFRAYGIDLADRKSASETRTRLIERCKLAFQRGQRSAKKNQPAITAKARALRKA